MARFICGSCGTPLLAPEGGFVDDGEFAAASCPVCKSTDLQQPGADPTCEEVRKQVGGQGLAAPLLSRPPLGEAVPFTGACYAVLQVGARGDDWAVYLGPAEGIDNEADAWDKLDKIVREGHVLTRAVAIRLFPFMNPSTYRE